MYDLREITRYVELTDKGIQFPEESGRSIRLDVLAEKPVSLYLKVGKDTPAFIGHFHGYDVVKFTVDGPCFLQADGPGCKIFTTEFQSEVIDLPDAVSFTRVIERKVRNPELERIELKMRENMERRLQQVTRDVTLRVSQRMREEHAEQERERFERASAEEAERIEASRKAAEKDAELAESGEADAGESGAGDVSGSGRKTPRQKLAAKPAS